MSGYLQRLVDTAAGRGDAVRPRTGSIFSPRPEEPRAPLQDRDDTEHAMLTPPPSHAHPASLELEPPEPARRVQPRSAHAPLLPNAVVADRRGAVDAPPPMHAAPDPASGPDAVDNVDDVDDVDGGRSSRPMMERAIRPLIARADEHVTVPAPASVHAADPFRPIMPPARVPDALVEAPGHGDRPRPHQGARAAQQPDEIQIHIGRIEVLAVPPPAPRAPKAPDRSLSLEAYLSRRDGRAR